MKLTRSLFICFTLLVINVGVFAAAPATNSAPSSSAPVEKQAAPSTNAPAATPPAPAAAQTTGQSKLDDYIKDLTSDLKLSDSEKQKITSYYTDDGAALKNILNDETLSPLQQAQQVADLRDARNAKIEALLHDLDRQQEFLRIEAQYRVALTKLAADGGLIAAAPPAAK